MVYNSLILSIVTFVYGAAGVVYLFAWIFRKEAAGKAATWITVAAWLGNTVGIILRWYESYHLGSEYGHAPFSTLYESLVFFAWTTGLIYLVIERRYQNRVIGAFAMPLACLALAYASLSPDKTIEPLIPALKSNWLIAHVITCFIGYAAFALAFGVSAMYLIKKGRDDEPIIWVEIVKPIILFVFAALFSRVLFVQSWIFAVVLAIPICLIFFGIVFFARKMSADSKARLLDRFPEPKILDELGYQLILLGFLFLSVGIITGAVWANSAWGRYWGWDPKETWSLITWFVYATLLHARMMRGWRGKRTAILSIGGFAAVIFTYFGVNLLPGLHSYGSF